MPLAELVTNRKDGAPLIGASLGGRMAPTIFPESLSQSVLTAAARGSVDDGIFAKPPAAAVTTDLADLAAQRLQAATRGHQSRRRLAMQRQQLDPSAAAVRRSAASRK